jgi:ribosome biogenesis GTPase
MALMDQYDFLRVLGWDDGCENFWREISSAGFIPGRVIGQEKTLYRVQFSKEVISPAAVTGKIWHDQESTGDLPAVGDWVACTLGTIEEGALIQQVFPRKTTLQRKRPGTNPIMQLIATNVDYMFIVTSLNEDFNIRRIERYLKMARDAGTKPVLLLTKSDLSNNRQEVLESLSKEFSDLASHFISKEDPSSMDALKPYFEMGRTSVLLGSSGVGKSTLVNFLTGSSSQKTQGVSHDSKGRHTTTSRHLLLTQWGGMIIDTPGMREISVQDDEVVDFSDVEEVFLKCKFSDCQHKTEPGCAVHKALKDQSLSQARWSTYLTRATQKNDSRKDRNKK